MSACWSRTCAIKISKISALHHEAFDNAMKYCIFVTFRGLNEKYHNYILN